MKRALVEAIGWLGAAAILLAYALNSFEVLLPSDAVYQILNGLGAMGIVVVSVVKRAYQPAALNLAWTAIAVVALLRMLVG